MNNHVIETVSFKLKADITNEQFLAATKPVTAFLQAQPGFVGRHLSSDGEGQWLDHVEWKSMEQAQAAAAKFPTDPSLATLGGSLDFETVVMKHSKLMLSH